MELACADICDVLPILQVALTVAVLIFYGIVSVVTNLAVDLSYGIVDPRVRVGGKKE